MNLWSVCQQLENQGDPYVLVTVTDIQGSAPQVVGAKMVVTKQGLHFGTVGGGKIEQVTIKIAQNLLEKTHKQPPQSQAINLQKDIGMSCGGVMTFLWEHFVPAQWPIVIFGAGHVAQALAKVLQPLECKLVFVDSRLEWINKFDKNITTLCHADPKELVKTFDSKSFFLCLTMGHAYDVPILLEIFKHAPESPYVGVIGSDVKGQKIKKELFDLGVSHLFLEKLKVPMGLKLGSNHPQEIAISIAAELLMVRELYLSTK